MQYAPTNGKEYLRLVKEKKILTQKLFKTNRKDTLNYKQYQSTPKSLKRKFFFAIDSC
jgi:hypothetical protein